VSADRRELSTRAQAWPRAIAGALARVGITPNQVSVLSIVVAAGAWYAYCLAAANWEGTATWWLVAAAAGIQLRLLCNLLDGLLAIEGGLKTKTGDLYNEIPDRAADILILLGAGLAVRHCPYGMELAVAATLLAVLTAYVRLLGGSLGLKQDFRGPMAKQHRMFTLTVGTLAAAVEHAVRGKVELLYVAVIVIVVGTALTLVLRTVRMARALNAR
jgi:phosphatidylglycerophosphate synthase